MASAAARPSPPRRIIQIIHSPETALEHAYFGALCDDGTVWVLTLVPRGGVTTPGWIQLPDIPQDKA